MAHDAFVSLKQGVDLLIGRYNSLAPLSPQDVALFQALGPIEITPHGQELIIEGAPVRSPRFLVSGWACRFRILGDGRRKIITFLLPGDAIGICGRARPLGLCNAAAVIDCQTLNAASGFDDIWDNADRHPQLIEALRLASALDEKLLLDHIVRLGRQTAFERLGHLLMELHWRLDRVGLAESWSFNLPLTQELLADATGLSIVHVNRTLQQMRKDGLIEWRQRNQMLTILDAELLQEISEFQAPRLSEWGS